MQGPDVLPIPVRNCMRPVLFSCARCGANLEVTADTKRILTCSYCDSDLFLPDALWRALHPVQKRRPFWVRFDA
jgi:DNA-directed RNA polymerase subunit RPC12/RpoP